jgi:hypothetical protein
MRHERIIAVVLVIAIGTFFGGVLQHIRLFTSDSLAAIYSKVLVVLANEDRADKSIGELSINPLLEEAARLKAEDMASKGYFAHYGPDGTAPWDWIDKAGYAYSYAGENLAIDFTDSDQVDRAWMNSPTHRANILNSTFTEIGIATASGMYNGKETIFVVQMFGAPKTAQAYVRNILPEPQNPEIKKVETKKSNLVVVASSSAVVANTEETFVAVRGASTNITAVEVTQAERIATNPTKVAFAIYLILFTIISIGLISLIWSDFHAHHIRHAVLCIALLVVIVTLAYTYQTLIVSHIVIT